MSWEIFGMERDCDQRLERRTQGSLRQAPAPVPEQSCAPPTHFLIANLELKLPVNPIKINELKFSNRKYLAIFRVGLERFSANPLRSTFLIETPRLKFPATPTKQSPLVDPNRDKTRVLRPQWRNGLFCPAFRPDLYFRSTDNSLCDSVPPWPSSCAAPGATLTLHAPQSNLAASCFVRALAGEHS
jgi:hypothetical protein